MSSKSKCLLLEFWWEDKRKKNPLHFHRVRDTSPPFLLLLLFGLVYFSKMEEKIRQLIYLNAAVSALATVMGKLGCIIGK